MMQRGWLVVVLSAVGAAANTCSGKLLQPSKAPGCALDRCHCTPSISMCDVAAVCAGSPTSPMCQGQCVLTPLGVVLFVCRTLVIIGCPIAVVLHHVYRRRQATSAVVSSNDIDEDGQGGDGLVEQVQAAQLLHRLQRAVRDRRSAVARLARRISRQLSTHHSDSYGKWEDTPALAFPPEPPVTMNKLDAYIDLTKLKTANARGAYVIELKPQIYLETMHKNALPTLLASILALVVLTVYFGLYPTSMSHVGVQLNGTSCLNPASRVPCLAYSDLDVNGTSFHRSISFHHPELPTAPDLLSVVLRFDPSNSTLDGQNDIVRFGSYTVRLSAQTAAGASTVLVDGYTNNLTTRCGRPTSQLSCTAVPLVSASLKRFGMLVYDGHDRATTFVIDINATTPWNSMPPFVLEVDAAENPLAWLAQMTRGLVGCVCCVALVHFLVKLQQFRRVTDSTTRWWSYGHLSLERKAMATVLALLTIHSNPVLLVFPSWPTASPAYVTFRTVWETLTYTASLGALLTIVDSYRKDIAMFENGASVATVGLRFVVVKGTLLGAVVAGRLALLFRLPANMASITATQVVGVVDTLLFVTGFSIFLGVATRVHRHLGGYQYSATRYQSLAFRYVLIIAYAAMGVLLAQANIDPTTGDVAQSAAAQAVLPAASVVTEVAFAVLMLFCVVGFYPPSSAPAASKGALASRGYVLRERRQFACTPRNSPVPVLSPVLSESLEDSSCDTPLPIDGGAASPVAGPAMDERRSVPAAPRSFLSRTPAFRGKPASEPHKMFCLETACFLFNCSRHAYYRSSLNLARDHSPSDGVLMHPASAYVNQAALVRDDLHEAATIHDAGTDTHCVVFKSASKVVFAFRGTVTKQNVKTDLEIAISPIEWLAASDAAGKTSLLVHRGFLASYNAVRAQLHEALTSTVDAADTSHIYCTGHSLGGALATLAAIDFKRNIGKRVIMYNFGSPRVGTHAFAAEFNAEVPLAYRVVNEGDVICGMPQRMSLSCFGRRKRLYKHVGSEVVMDAKTNGDFLIRPTFAEATLIVEARKRPGRHLLKEYKVNLDEILTTALAAEATVGERRDPNPLEAALYGMVGSIDDEDFINHEEGAVDARRGASVPPPPTCPRRNVDIAV